VGTGAGMGTAFVFDIAEQAGKKGIGNVDVGHAGGAALDAFPESFMAALPTGLLRAAMVTRVEALYEGLAAARQLGVATKAAELAVKARVVAGVAMYGAASRYVGDMATVAYLAARGKTKEAEEVYKSAPVDSLLAGGGAILMMPFSGAQGANGIIVDAGLN